MALEAAASCEAVLEQSCQQWLLGGECRQTVADVSGGQHPEFPTEHAAAAAVISNGDDGGDVTAVALEAAQQGGETGAPSDGDDVRAAVQPALGSQGIHQNRVLVRRQGLLDGAEAAALAPQHQPDPDDHHQRARDLPRKHRGDGAQHPAQGLNDPVDRLEISPDRCSEQSHHQAESGGEQPALHHQSRLEPADRPLRSGHQILASLGPYRPGPSFAVRSHLRLGAIEHGIP